ncbi:GMC family oxidoreductase N-terminal domain-containing protein [Glutamicibacter nicotianae]|uniref:GMC family oxidoreductase N-terminal domain-containing protein n=1 Tax=Glutamicibacter nicotianae TaxID=37929 RepID=UPI00195D4774
MGLEERLADLQAYRELFSGGASKFHGTEGLVPVDNDYELDEIHQSIIDAAVQSGIEFNPDYNGEQLDGVSKEQINVVVGERINTWKAYLKPVRERLEIITDAEVHSVILESGTAGACATRRTGSCRSCAPMRWCSAPAPWAARSSSCAQESARRPNSGQWA